MKIPILICANPKTIRKSATVYLHRGSWEINVDADDSEVCVHIDTHGDGFFACYGHSFVGDLKVRLKDFYGNVKISLDKAGTKPITIHAVKV